MKNRFNPLLLAGVALLALASAANAGQPLSDRQMDGVTAGLGNNLIALANAAAVSIGNFDSATATLTATVTDQGLGSSVAESATTAAASSAITAAFIKVGSNATASGAFN
jgi:hypothetical protein